MIQHVAGCRIPISCLPVGIPGPPIIQRYDIALEYLSYVCDMLCDIYNVLGKVLVRERLILATLGFFLQNSN
jgi:hypothetical protein